VELHLDRLLAVLDLLLERLECGEVAFVLCDLEDCVGAVGADELVLEVDVADVEAERLHVVAREASAEAGTLERPGVAPLFPGVAEAGDTESTRSVEKTPERLGAADRHDLHALQVEMTPQASCQRLERDAVTDSLDEDYCASVHTHMLTQVSGTSGIGRIAMFSRCLRLAPGAVGFAVLVLTVSSCGSSKSATAGERTISYSRVVDLTHVIDPSIPLWPGDPHVVFKTVATMSKDGYYLRSFTIGEHSATHMNAPNSFIADNTNAITSYPAQNRVAPAVVIDVREEAAANPDYQLTKQDVAAWEKKHGKIAAGSFVILFTGWQDRWSNPKSFINQDEKGNLHFPGFAGATTKWLLSDRQISGVGIDTHGVDPGLDTSYKTNTQIAKAHKIAIECMANLDQLPPTGATLVLGPLQLRDGSGSPMSLIAFVP
jgi:kynurenine formamidase